MITDLGLSCGLITVPSAFKSGIQMRSPGDSSFPSMVIIEFHLSSVLLLFPSDVITVWGLWL